MVTNPSCTLRLLQLKNAVGFFLDAHWESTGLKYEDVCGEDGVGMARTRPLVSLAQGLSRCLSQRLCIYEVQVAVRQEVVVR